MRVVRGDTQGRFPCDCLKARVGIVRWDAALTSFCSRRVFRARSTTVPWPIGRAFNNRVLKRLHPSASSLCRMASYSDTFSPERRWKAPRDLPEQPSGEDEFPDSAEFRRSC